MPPLLPTEVNTMELLFGFIFFVVCIRLLHELLHLPPHSLMLPAILLTLIGYPVLKALLFTMLQPFFLLADSQYSAYLLVAVIVLVVIFVAVRLLRHGSLFNRDPFGHF